MNYLPSTCFTLLPSPFKPTFLQEAALSKHVKAASRCMLLLQQSNVALRGVCVSCYLHNASLRRYQHGYRHAARMQTEGIVSLKERLDARHSRAL